MVVVVVAVVVMEVLVVAVLTACPSPLERASEVPRDRRWRARARQLSGRRRNGFFHLSRRTGSAR